MEKLKDIQPDILITDIQMQVMSGLELIKKSEKRTLKCFVYLSADIRSLNMRNGQLSTEFQIIFLNQLFRQK